MFVVILAGGRGTRLSEETVTRPKPMVEIGGRPILWHIMKLYSKYGFNDFVLCLGYKGEVIRDYFVNYAWKTNDIRVDLANSKVHYHTGDKPEPWQVWMLNTGERTNTGGRLRHLRLTNFFMPENGTFMMTYGDGVGNVDIPKLLAYHKSHGKLATVTCAAPPGRFGTIQMDGNGQVTSFEEKAVGGDGRVNAGFFVLNQAVLSMIESADTSFEQEVLPRLTSHGQLMAYRHDGFWKPMDTARDRDELQAMLDKGNAPWEQP